jgi:hypothetical protein
LLGLTLLLAFSLRVQAQTEEQTGQSEPISAVPIFTMGTGFITFFPGGTPNLGPLINPEFVVPIGQNFLFETRLDLEADLVPDPNGPGWKGPAEKNVDYVQLDYIANRYLTAVIGRYLLPFGIYNERLYPIFIRNLQTDPLILPIEAGDYGSGTGAQLRGGFSVAPDVELNYATYFSAHSDVTYMGSTREAGGRVGIFLPAERLELGGEFQHLLESDHTNSFGFYGAWQPRPLPLDIRAEYARSEDGSGYWLESAYRLSQVPVWNRAFRHVQAVARMQQFFLGNPNVVSNTGLTANTNQFEFGLNYYFRDDFRFVSSYGRQFSSAGDLNIWTVGFTYRLVLPLWPGGGR